MCGIAGLVLPPSQTIDPASLEPMIRALHTRGPDANGTYINKNTALIHTRLSIIDLEHGAQPMTDPKGRTIIFNGEIYNDPEIRASLKDYNFKTRSDTESILALYDQYGLDFTSHLRGMYAFALHDPQQNRFILARDPFGIKPLYILHNARMLAFASEIKALKHLDNESAKTIPQKLRAFKKQNFLPGDQTPCETIIKLLPGERRVYENLNLIETRRRDLLPTIITQTDEQTALQKLEQTLMDSVKVHCRSDVGYGLFLSGGTDSTAIAACLHALGEKQIRSYTAAFDIPSAADERQLAKQTAAKFGLTHREILFTEHDFWDLLPEIAAYMDDPVADYAILPTWKLAQEAAKDQKVILCGEGGDELLAGYGRYRARWWKDWRRLLSNDSKDLNPTWSALQKKQARDIYGWLPNDLLIKLDNCLMAHGLEGRTPFLDPEVAAVAFALPDHLKQQGKHGKYLLKKWLQTRYPEYPAFRKKQGFTVPVGDWIDRRKAHALDIITQSPLIQNMLSQSEIAALPNTNGDKLWPLLYLAFWGQSRQL